MQKAFSPLSHATSLLMVDGTTVKSVLLKATADSVMVDNRGDSDLLVEFGSDPLDADSFRIPPKNCQILGKPKTLNSISFKRTSGATSERVFVYQGTGAI